MPKVQAFRVFAWNATVSPQNFGGALHVARSKQGAGRHDSPADFGIYYCASSAESAVAESIQEYRGQKIEPADLIRWRMPLSLVTVEFDDLPIIDFDDPAQLLALKTRPSIVASPSRTQTQVLAKQAFALKTAGISWWSTLNSPWANFSIFTDKDFVNANIVAGPSPLALTNMNVINAAKAIGVRI